MTTLDTYSVRPVGVVRSVLQRRQDAPKQGREGAPEAWIEIEAEFFDALDGIKLDAEMLVFTWLHLGNRETLKVHPRDEPTNALRGVFATRSPDRPNPIGLHEVTVLQVDPRRGILVRPLEAIDGTPVIDIKPVLCGAKQA